MLFFVSSELAEVSLDAFDLSIMEGESTALYARNTNLDQADPTDSVTVRVATREKGGMLLLLCRLILFSTSFY